LSQVIAIDLDDLAALRSSVSDDVELSRTVGLVDDTVRRWLTEGPHGDPPFNCIVWNIDITTRLGQVGLSVRLWRGWIKTGEKAWLEHGVSVVELPNHMVVIDLSVGQLSRYKGAPFFVMVADRKESVERRLNEALDWWIAT
jgi:hypothetical protein